MAAVGSTIVRVQAREILDSRGFPTVEADVVLADGTRGRAAVPSGASTGKHEAVELRDNDAKHYQGKGVQKAVQHVNVAIHKALKGFQVEEQERIDEALLKLDGTPNKASLGANAMLAASLAVARAAAASRNLELYEYLAALNQSEPLLPLPFANVINGGKHAAGKLRPQEFMIVPVGARTFAEAAQMVSECYHALRGLLEQKYGKGATHVGDEGGFAPPMERAEEALGVLAEAVKRAGYQDRVAFALDPAASEFCTDHRYDLGAASLAPEELLDYWLGLAKKYPIISLEDPFDQDDGLSWHMLMKKRPRFQVVGDDLTVTNPARIQQAIDDGWCDALLLKVNQVGTLTEALRAARLAIAHGWNVMVSHRSGETEDAFIADLAVALGCGQIKLGAPCRGERTAKYNRLLRIEERLGKKACLPKFTLPD